MRIIPVLVEIVWIWADRVRIEAAILNKENRDRR